MSKTRLKLTRNHFSEVGTVVSAPSGWSGKIDAADNRFERVGRIVEFRDKPIEVPAELVELARETYNKAISGQLTQDQAVVKVTELPEFRSFLKEKGIEMAGLGVGLAQLITQLLGL